MRTIQELADTTTSHNTALIAKIWLDRIIGAARKKMFFMSMVQEYDVPQGNNIVNIPYRKGYWSTLATTVTDTTTEGTPVTFTAMNTLTGLNLTVAPHAYGIAISNFAKQVTTVNLIQAAREELTDYWADIIDKAIASGIDGAAVASTSAKGASLLYGGDAYSTTTLAAGDTMTTSLISKAKTRLQGTTMKYWDGATETISVSYPKTPWFSEPDQPFVVFLGPEQEYILLTDSQFTNAAEYGGQEIVLNGEIGKYHGVKVITSVNTTSNTAWGSGANIPGHNCYMIKAKMAAALAWSQRPRLRVFEYPSELETRLVLEQIYAVDSFHDDSICHIKVADE